VEVWLRGNDFATTDVVELNVAAPALWRDLDVREVLKALLRSIDRAKNPEADPDRPVILRGFNWIVSPFEGGGYTIAVEIQTGAAAAGPFDVEQAELDQMITRLVAEDRVAPAAPHSVH